MPFLNSDFSSKSFSKSITYGNSILLHLKCSPGFIILYIYIFTGRGESIIYGKEKRFVHCSTVYGSGYWWGCTHTNGSIYAPTLDTNFINLGLLNCRGIYITIVKTVSDI